LRSHHRSRHDPGHDRPNQLTGPWPGKVLAGPDLTSAGTRRSAWPTDAGRQQLSANRLPYALPHRTHQRRQDRSRAMGELAKRRRPRPVTPHPPGQSSPAEIAPEADWQRSDLRVGTAGLNLTRSGAGRSGHPRVSPRGAFIRPGGDSVLGAISAFRRGRELTAGPRECRPDLGGVAVRIFRQHRSSIWSLLRAASSRSARRSRCRLTVGGIAHLGRVARTSSGSAACSKKALQPLIASLAGKPACSLAGGG
jgi:hypothetical protein